LWASEQGSATSFPVVSAAAIRRDLARRIVFAQIVDNLRSDEHVFRERGPVKHIDFTEPYTGELRSRLYRAEGCGEPVDGGRLCCDPGPRLETAAEIDAWSATAPTSSA